MIDIHPELCTVTKNDIIVKYMYLLGKIEAFFHH